jgi:hypothetical protein
MRKISANYIFPVTSASLKNGIIILDDQNRIEDIIDTKNSFKEIANLEYYGGVIVPGFIDTFNLLSYKNFLKTDFFSCLHGNFHENLTATTDNLQSDLSVVQRGINHLEAFGTKAAADWFADKSSKQLKDKSKIFFPDLSADLFIQLPGKESYKTDSLVLLNRFTIKNIDNLQYDLPNLCIGTGSLGTHQKLSVFEELKNIQQKFSDFPFDDLIKCATINPAKILDISNEFGSLEIGKKPGLNLISGVDISGNKILPNGELKLII